MDDDQTRQSKKAKAATAALILGAFGLATGRCPSRPTGRRLRRPLRHPVSFGLFTACGGKGERPCPCSWPGDDDAPTPCEAPTPSASLEPTPESTRWQERTATPTAIRSR